MMKKLEKLSSEKFKEYRKSTIINPSTIMGGRCETDWYHGNAQYDYYDWTGNNRDNFVTTNHGSVSTTDSTDAA